MVETNYKGMLFRKLVFIQSPFSPKCEKPLQATLHEIVLFCSIFQDNSVSDLIGQEWSFTKLYFNFLMFTISSNGDYNTISKTYIFCSASNLCINFYHHHLPCIIIILENKEF